MPPDNIVLRYISVQNLARSGAPGERDNARRILEQMREKYPDIESAARHHESKNTGTDYHPDQDSRRGSPNDTRARDTQSRWEDFFRYGQAFVNGVSGFAENFGNVAMGRQLANYVESNIRVSKAQNILLTLKFGPGILRTAQEDLNPLQLHAFREEMHHLLDGLLGQLFEPTVPEEEAEE